MSNSIEQFPEFEEFKEEQYFDKEMKDAKEIKKALRIDQSLQGTFVWAVAVHDDLDLNGRIEIQTRYGIPLTPEVHDTVRDVYIIEGISTHELGRIPVNYRLVMEDADFEIFIPLPFAVIKNYLTSEQKKLFRQWKSAFKEADCHFRFFQIRDTE